MNVRLKCETKDKRQKTDAEESDKSSPRCKNKTLFRKSANCIQKISYHLNCHLSIKFAIKS